MKRSRAALLVTLIVTSCAPRAPEPVAGTLALVGVTLIDGLGGPPRAGMTIVIDGDRISRVAPSSHLVLDPSLEVYEISGTFVTPGFTDTHMHLRADADLDLNIRELLARGITAVRSTGASPDIASDIKLREELRSGARLGPHFRVAGQPIEGPGVPASPSFAVRVSNEADLRELVGRHAEVGVDFIKLRMGLAPPLVEAGIEEAHRHGLRAIAHTGGTTWGEAARLGVDILVHLHAFVSAVGKAGEDPAGEDARELARLLARNGVEVNPNLVNLKAAVWGRDRQVLDHLVSGGDPRLIARTPFPHPRSPRAEDQTARGQAVFQTSLQLTRLFHEAGVMLTAGTDAPLAWILPGVSFHRELELLVEAGISPLDVIRIATHNGAAALGLLEEIGTVEVGKIADLVVLGSDPSIDISSTQDIVAVFRAGVPVTGATQLARFRVNDRRR